ncbi:hypothetical protein ACHQM5_029432 [Ranunculus cassubicifolius]
MSGRNRMPRHGIEPSHHRRGGYLPPEGPYTRPMPRLPHPSLLEEEIDMQMIDRRRLLDDNRKLNDDRIILQQELAVAKEDVHRMSMLIADIRAEQDVHERELIQKGLKLEGDIKALEPLRNEVVQLRGEVQKLNVVRQELNGKVNGLSQEVVKAQADNKQIPLMKADVDALRQELIRARNAFEYEKKTNTELKDHLMGLEKDIVTMAREVEKLRATGSDSRQWGAGGVYSHGVKLGSPEGAYPPYGNGYGLHSGIADKGPLYGMGSGSWGGLERGGLENPRLGRR